MSGRNKHRSNVKGKKTKPRSKGRAGRKPASQRDSGRLVRIVAAAVGLAIVVGLLWWFSRTSIPDFDQDRALSNIERIVEFGPRVPGSDSHAQNADWMVGELEQFADQVTRQPFRVAAGGDSLDGLNIIASFNLQPERNMRVMLSAHWDTRPWADADPDSSAHKESFSGANDGASGVAVLLELARAIQSEPLDFGVDILLFDLEDSGRDSTVAYALGSEYFASTNTQYRPTFGINIDMVCDAQLEIPREANSVSAAGRIVNLIWDAARKEDATVFVDRSGMSVMDDHIPFLQRGIPVVNLIHLPFPDYWHTREDTPDKCSAESLGQVGRVILRILYEQ